MRFGRRLGLLEYRQYSYSFDYLVACGRRQELHDRGFRMDWRNAREETQSQLTVLSNAKLYVMQLGFEDAKQRG